MKTTECGDVPYSPPAVQGDPIYGKQVSDEQNQKRRERGQSETIVAYGWMIVSQKRGEVSEGGFGLDDVGGNRGALAELLRKGALLRVPEEQLVRNRKYYDSEYVVSDKSALGTANAGILPPGSPISAAAFARPAVEQSQVIDAGGRLRDIAAVPADDGEAAFRDNLERSMIIKNPDYSTSKSKKAPAGA